MVTDFMSIGSLDNECGPWSTLWIFFYAVHHNFKIKFLSEIKARSLVKFCGGLSLVRSFCCVSVT